MPLHRWHDRKQKFNRMEEDDSVFVYREGTLDEALLNLYQNSSEDSSPYSSPNNNTNNSICAVTTTYAPNVVPLKDVIVL
ncbi:hypothetical protein RJ641_019701 [Dillenia turbinata]|uniref:Uncharacterized protein n=1 Tax=Dillenia turbinata TaxID=194707 RepID=A0AAN8UJX1_9MAGN